MTAQTNKNVAMLREVFGEGDLYARELVRTFELDGVELVCDYRSGSTAERFYIVKPAALVERYLELAERSSGAKIVELGIAEGGSTALLTLAARPDRLLAVDLEPNRLAALDDLVSQRGLGDHVRACYGVDQSDRAGLSRLVDTELDGGPIDVVIDDASHQLDATRTSFETLFPRLRPGGLYVIEDWNADLIFRHAVIQHIANASDEERSRFRAQMQADGQEPAAAPARRPLSDLAIELVLARGTAVDDAIAEVSVDEFWVTVRRGEAELDPETFRLAERASDHFGYLT